MVNSKEEDLNHGSEPSNGTPGTPNSPGHEHQNKRLRFFEIMTFFLGIVIATLCHGLYTIFYVNGKPDIVSAGFWPKVIYALSFLIFLLKCFADDVMDDYDNDSKIKTLSRESVTFFVVSWVFILFAALSINQVSISSLLLVVGLLCLILFICRIAKDNPDVKKEKRYCCYAKENAALIIILLIVAVLSCPFSSCPLSRIDCQEIYGMVVSKLKELVPVIVLLFFCFYLFISPLLKGTRNAASGDS